ncbi:hypothetical protein SEA_SUIGENERIS_33 [Mycobacterium phage Suigeneris]|uniref:Uncharacterized protein n=2 Tax=Acadianvirus acadian TaxID=1982901 RepID=A0A7M1CMA8_9CAUD|nr:head protein [Mycobacterium phage Acadian]AER48947.1 hypothetical protein ACADIAN_33 [Mycobacterium phage Acadian]QOP65575.1 hypothetical protein SEA_SUIGENERIS_33 [Mycobacterium phage Suigeneris]WUT94803.1 hypothetical protein PRODRIGUEZ_33 [Mycobacterium phage PRodriguez]
MTVGITAYLANKLLDHVGRNVAYTPPAVVYAKAHLGDPGATGAANASAQTTRLALSFAAAASGSMSANTTPEWTLNATENISHVSFWDAPTGGNCLWTAAASVTKGGVSGDIIRIATDTLAFSPIAA